MPKHAFFVCVVSLLVVAAGSGGPVVGAQGRSLDIYFIDVEGGQATLFVSPSGESMLVDAGYAGFNGRDADRIVATARGAGLQQIDYLVISHFHGDHVGGVPELAARLPIRAFVDAGATTESDEAAQTLFANYAKVRAAGRHIVALPGDVIPVRGLDVRILAAAADLIKAPLPDVPGAGSPNPLCRDFTPKPPEQGPRLRPSTIGKPWSENFQSVAVRVAFGNFRLLDLGDLAWNQEGAFVCPNNLLGSADVYLTTAHGQQISGPSALVHAVRPRAIVMNNAARKGGDSPTMRIVRTSPGADLWQLHFSFLSAKDENAPEAFIANLGEQDAGHSLRVSVEADGSFVVTNGRTGFSKAYAARSR